MKINELSLLLTNVSIVYILYGISTTYMNKSKTSLSINIFFNSTRVLSDYNPLFS